MQRVLVVGQNNAINNDLAKAMNKIGADDILATSGMNEFTKAMDSDNYRFWLNNLLNMDVFYPQQYIVYCYYTEDVADKKTDWPYREGYNDLVIKYLKEVIADVGQKTGVWCYVVDLGKKGRVNDMAKEIYNYMNKTLFSEGYDKITDTKSGIYELVL